MRLLIYRLRYTHRNSVQVLGVFDLIRKPKIANSPEISWCCSCIIEAEIAIVLERSFGMLAGCSWQASEIKW